MDEFVQDEPVEYQEPGQEVLTQPTADQQALYQSAMQAVQPVSQSFSSAPPALDEAGKQALYQSAMQAVQPVGQVAPGQQAAQAQPSPTAADFQQPVQPQQMQPQQQQPAPAQKTYQDLLKESMAPLQADLKLAKSALGGVQAAAEASKNAQISAAKDLETIHQSAEFELAEAYKNSTEKAQKFNADREAALKEYKESNTPESLSKAFRPHGIFEDASTGQAILGAIAIGLGGIGAAMQGGNAQNQALGMIMKRVDKENEMRASAHRTRQAGLVQRADEAGKSYQYTRQEQQDATTNINNRKILQIETIKSQLEKTAAEFSSAQVKANASQMIAGLSQQQAALNQQVMKMQIDAEMAKSLSGLTHEKYKLLSPAQKAMVPKQMTEEFQKMAEVEVPGIGYATNKSLATQINTDRQDAEEGIRGGERLLELFKSSNKFIPNEEHAEIGSRMRALMGPLRKQLGLGVMSEADKKLVEGIIGNPNKIFSLPSYEKHKMKVLVDDFKEGWNRKLKNAGLKPPVENPINKQLNITRPKFK